MKFLTKCKLLLFVMVLSLFSVEATRIGFGSLTQKVGSRTANRNLQEPSQPSFKCIDQTKTTNPSNKDSSEKSQPFLDSTKKWVLWYDCSAVELVDGLNVTIE